MPAELNSDSFDQNSKDMKTLLYSTAVVLFSAGTAFSQLIGDDSRDELFFGVKAGINASNVYNEKSADFQGDAKAGFAGGVFFQLPINSFIGIQPELLVSMKGYQATETNGATRTTYKRSLSYIDVPVMLQIKPVRFFTLLVGPEISILANTTDSHISTTGNSTTTSSTTSQPGDLRKVNAGVLAGFDLNIGRHFVIAPRVGWDLLSNNPNNGGNNPNLKNFWFQACIGLRF